MNEKVKRTEKHEKARNSLPDDLVPVFDDLVKDYMFFANTHHGSPFVSYIVLAELINTGWRVVARPKYKSPLEDERSESE